MEGSPQDTQQNIVSTVDKNGGWLRKDYTTTWYTLTRLSDLQGEITARADAITKLQTEKADLEAKLAQSK